MERSRDNPEHPPENPDTKKPVIGLVGGIGSGKSLVARGLGELGCAVIDADRLARDALEDPRTRRTLTEWWGPDVLRPDGSVDRRAVGKIVFNDPSQRKRLEGVVHPEVNAMRERLRKRYLDDPRYIGIVEDCPLLMEAGLDGDCDVIIFVRSTLENRLRRVTAKRGWTDQELQLREKNQLGLDIKAQRADYILDNDAGENECLSQVRRVFSKILHEIPG